MKLREVLSVPALAVVYAAMWWLLTLLKVTFDVLPLSWFSYLAQMPNRSETLKITSVRALWYIDFALPVLLAAFVVSYLSRIYFNNITTQKLIVVGALAFAGLFWLLAVMEPAYVPDWASYPMMAATFLGFPIAARAMIRRG